jgi:hypothetical protein
MNRPLVWVAIAGTIVFAALTGYRLTTIGARPEKILGSGDGPRTLGL